LRLPLLKSPCRSSCSFESPAECGGLNQGRTGERRTDNAPEIFGDSGA
jgi:hypothetical protein